jgi:glycogen synthase
MNIAFVTREFPPSRRCGGIGAYAWEMAKYLGANGHTIFVVAASDDIYHGSHGLEDGIHVVRLPGADFFLGGGPSLISKVRSHARGFIQYMAHRRRVAQCLLRLSKEHSIDLIEFPDYGNEAVAWTDINPSIPWVVRLHTPTILNRRTARPYSCITSPAKWVFGRAELRTLQKADAISSCSQALANIMVTIAGLRREQITIIPNAIDPGMWIPSRASSPDARRPDSISIFSAGTIAEGKGYAELVSAVQKLRWRGIPISLEIAGAHGKLGRKLSRDTRPGGRYESWLRLPGLIPRAELANRYANADLVVFPAWWDNFPMVCVEAMASGALVLGSRSGGMAEIIRENREGFLFDPSDPESLSTKIFQVLQLPRDYLHDIRERAQQRARSTYSVQKVAETQLVFYERVIHGSESSH